METLEAIRKRCSLKTHVSGRAISAQTLDIIFDAARLAGSARNFQPWRFIVVQDRGVLESLTPALSEANQVAVQAAALIVACARPADDVMHDGKEYYMFDVGMAVANMLLAATDLGLVTHLMAAFDEAKIKQILHIPEDVRVVIVTPLAYPLESSYDEAAAERLSKRTRKDLSELVYAERWSEPEPA